MTPLSDEWFATARELAEDLPPIDGLAYGVELRATAGGPTWHQDVRDGRVARWELGAHPSPDLVLQVDAEALDALHDPDGDGTATTEALHVVFDDGSLHLPAPLDVTETDEIQRMPTVPGGDLRVQYHLAAGPFGPVSTWMTFTDGRYEAAALGTIDDADVTVWAGFEKMALLRRGEITVLEALEDGGRVDGDVGPLMLLAGLHEGELQLAQEAAGPSSTVLAAMGRLRATDAYRAVLVALADRS